MVYFFFNAQSFSRYFLEIQIFSLTFNILMKLLKILNYYYKTQETLNNTSIIVPLLQIFTKYVLEFFNRNNQPNL